MLEQLCRGVHLSAEPFERFNEDAHYIKSSYGDKVAKEAMDYFHDKLVRPKIEEAKTSLFEDELSDDYDEFFYDYLACFQENLPHYAEDATKRSIICCSPTNSTI